MPETVLSATLTPELLYLLSADPAELAETVAPLRGADVAESLNRMAPEGAARVLANLPFEFAVEVLDEPELDRRHVIVEHMERGVAGALVGAMAPDRAPTCSGSCRPGNGRRCSPASTSRSGSSSSRSSPIPRTPPDRS